MRHAYEWEAPIENESDVIAKNIARLREETSQITNTTLQGKFRFEEDRQYWVKKLAELNGQLHAFEEQAEQLRKGARRKS